MSGLAGILRLDGGPVDPAALRAMAGAQAHRGPDGVADHVDGPVGLVHQEHRTGAAERSGAQPLVDRDGRACLTFDGRVANRPDLLAALGPDREALRDGSDAELVLHLYLRFGRAAVARIVGDFALALWDAAQHELVLGRDVLGKRPLHHLRDRRPGIDALRWGSEVTAVLADPAVRRRPNPGMVAEHLAHAVTSTTETVYAEVLRVPPAHLLIAGLDGTVRTERYWSWDPATARPRTRRPSPAADREHVERFLEVFGAAVASAVDAPEPVAAELSGGVDSSSVVGMASQVLRDAGRRPLDLYALVFPGQKCDESEHVHAVAELHGLVAHEHAPAALGAEPYEAETRRTLLPAGPPNLAMHHASLEAARAAGSRVVLTGQGGDEWFVGSPFALADDLRRANLRGLRRRFADDGRLWRASSPLHHLVRDGLLPLAGRAHRAAPRVGLMPEAFRREVHLDERLHRPPLPVRTPSLATAHVATLLDSGAAVHVAERAEQDYARHGLERRAPFDDRRVVELALSLPDDLRRRGLATKWIVRTAMEGLVPDTVRRRGDKADFMPLFTDELEAQGGARLFESMAIADLGWVHLPTVRSTYGEVAAAAREGRGHPFTWCLWNALCIERWIGLLSSP